MKNIKVSVIVPIYNVEDYLRECLNSLERQTLKAIEVIMVNDGATDNSGKIAKEYSERNINFTLLERENGGLSAARNTGLEKATGEYVYFIDSDDYLVDNALEKLYIEAKEKDLDVLKFSAYTFTEQSKEMIWSSKEGGYKYQGEYSDVYEGVDIMEKFVQNNDYCFPSCCLILTRRDAIEANCLRFYEGIIHEDNLFHFQLLLLSKRCTVMNLPFYCRRVRTGSITQTADWENKARSLCIIAEEGEHFLEQYPFVKGKASDWYIRSWIFQMVDFWLNMNFKMRCKAEIRDYYRRAKKIAKMHNYFNNINIWLFMFSKQMYLLCVRIRRCFS